MSLRKIPTDVSKTEGDLKASQPRYDAAAMEEELRTGEYPSPPSRLRPLSGVGIYKEGFRREAGTDIPIFVEPEEGQVSPGLGFDGSRINTGSGLPGIDTGSSPLDVVDAPPVLDFAERPGSGINADALAELKRVRAERSVKDATSAKMARLSRLVGQTVKGGFTFEIEMLKQAFISTGYQQSPDHTMGFEGVPAMDPKILEYLRIVLSEEELYENNWPDDIVYMIKSRAKDVIYSGHRASGEKTVFIQRSKLVMGLLANKIPVEIAMFFGLELTAEEVQGLNLSQELENELIANGIIGRFELARLRLERGKNERSVVARPESLSVNARLQIQAQMVEIREQSGLNVGAALIRGRMKKEQK